MPSFTGNVILKMTRLNVYFSTESSHVLKRSLGVDIKDRHLPDCNYYAKHCWQIAEISHNLSLTRFNKFFQNPFYEGELKFNCINTEIMK